MNFLSQVSIKTRLTINAVVIAVALSILFILMVSNSTTMNELADTSVDVERLNAQVLMLRRNEKDFLSRKDLKYVDKFSANSQKLQDNIAKIQLASKEIGFSDKELKVFRTQTQSYSNKFAELAKFQQLIGLHPKDGLYGELRAAVHDVEELLKQNESYRLLADMLQLRRAEKDFMLRRDTKYLDKFANGMNTFQTHLDSEGLDSSARQRIKSLLSVYKTKFEALVAAEVKIGLDANSGLLGELRNTIHQTETSLDKLSETLNNELKASIEQAMVTAIGVFVIAISSVMAVVFLTSRSILNPILAVRNAIAHIRSKNDLTWLVRSKGNDELVELANDVNSLVSDFKQLIFNVNAALETLDQAAEEMAENAKETLSGMEKQFQESDMVATSGAEMQATVSDINQNTQTATATANKTGELAENGSHEVSLTSENIHELIGRASCRERV